MIKNRKIYVNWYHGTSSQYASIIQTGNIRVTLGGGELGRGFYMGNFLEEAKRWAFHKNGKKNVPNSVVQFEFQPWISFRYQVVSERRARIIYNYINNNRAQRNFEFQLDFVYSKVIGRNVFGFYQLKWESVKSESYLNNTAIRTYK